MAFRLQIEGNSPTIPVDREFAQRNDVDQWLIEQDNLLEAHINEGVTKSPDLVIYEDSNVIATHTDSGERWLVTEPGFWESMV